MLASVLLLLALLPPTADAGALPLAFFRQLQRLPYFGHGAGGRHDATSKLLSDANQAAQQSSKPQHAQHAGPGIRPVGPNEEAKLKEQEKHRPHPLHRPPHAYADRPTNRTAASAAAAAAAAAEGAKIVVPPPTTSGSNATTASGASAHAHVHHWGLRGDGYHAVMAGAWRTPCWWFLIVMMKDMASF